MANYFDFFRMIIYLDDVARFLFVHFVLVFGDRVCPLSLEFLFFRLFSPITDGDYCQFLSPPSPPCVFSVESCYVGERVQGRPAVSVVTRHHALLRPLVTFVLFPNP